MSVDAVEYSDRPLEEGPAPISDDIHRGQIAAFDVTTGSETLTAEFQFWKEADHGPEHFVGNAAGYMAWRIAGRTGEYGVFDGHSQRIWLGTERFHYDEHVYDYVDIGADWREKIHINDFIDRIWSDHLEYPDKQVGELTETDCDDLVPHAAASSPVYELTTKVLSSEPVHHLQFWRPPTCQAVFVASKCELGRPQQGRYGVMGKFAILTDIRRAISLDDDTRKKAIEVIDGLRSATLAGLTIVE